MAYKIDGQFNDKERTILVNFLRNLADELEGSLHVKNSYLSNSRELNDIFIGNQEKPFTQEPTGFETLKFEITYFDPDFNSLGPSPLLARLVANRKEEQQ